MDEFIHAMTGLKQSLQMPVYMPLAISKNGHIQSTFIFRLTVAFGSNQSSFATHKFHVSSFIKVMVLLQNRIHIKDRK
jgi:hypothetical protein